MSETNIEYIQLVRDIFLIIFSFVGIIVFIIFSIIIYKIYSKSNKIILRFENIMSKLESIVESSDITLKNLQRTIKAFRSSLSAGYLLSEVFKRINRLFK
jgi:type II secretory pathway component PulF|tara:strand:- start:692 stop:991 length:300 start_codon:yes stop_codon:yes gene_type:complete